MIESLETRIASWSQIPVSHGEPIQVLRYEPGQEYRAHYDYFFHEAGQKNNRIATVLMYLSDVEVRTHITYTGISTCLSSWTLLRACFTRQHLLLIYFLYVDRRVARLSFRTQACPMLVTDHCFRSVETPAKLSNPVKATPSVLEHKGWGELDGGSSHAGCPVVRGEKWTATKWMHVAPVSSHDANHRVFYEGREVGTEECRDTHETCHSWAEQKECTKNPGYMLESCPLSCAVCNGSWRDGSYEK